MKIFPFLLAALLLAANVSAQTLIVLQDFETDCPGTGWTSSFQGGGNWNTSNLGCTTSNPHGGTYALRANWTETDTITGLVAMGGNPLLKFHGGEDITTHTSELYFSAWFRHDDQTPSNPDDWSTQNEGKLIWLNNDNLTTTTQGMYIKNFLYNAQWSGSIILNYTNGGYSANWASSNGCNGGTTGCWSTSQLWFNPTYTGGVQLGTWRHFEYHIKMDECWLRLAIDGVILKQSRHGDSEHGASGYGTLLADGTTYYDNPASAPNCEVGDSGANIVHDGFSILAWTRSENHTKANGCLDNLDGAEFGAGYCTGWQIDDLEFWTSPPAGSAFVTESGGTPGAVFLLTQ